MNRRLAILLVSVSIFGVAYAAPKIYKYRCPKCGLVQDYDRPGSRKCPNDGRNMIRVY